MEQDKEPKKFDIFLVNLQEQNGSVQKGFRPCMVVQNNYGNYYSPTIIVAGMTSVLKKLGLPTHVAICKEYGLKKDSMVLTEQLFTISQSDLGNYIGNVSKESDRKRIDRALSNSLGLQT